MKIELHKIKIRDLAEGYKDSNEEGVVGWNGKLNIRPKYQREFVYKDKQRQLYDPAQMLEFEKVVILRVVDSHWTDHIDVMDQFRQSVGLRGYGQLNPLVEYQTAGYHMFEQMIADIEYETTRLFMKSEIRHNVER